MVLSQSFREEAISATVFSQSCNHPALQYHFMCSAASKVRVHFAI
jgi:hypothetical protein